MKKSTIILALCLGPALVAGEFGCYDIDDSGAAPDTDTGGDLDTETDSDSDMDGMPLPDAPTGVWTWVPVTDTYCRDGSEAGVSVRYADSGSDLFIFLEGGGACFNDTTCAGNPFRIESQTPGSSGIFDFHNEENPLQDFNAIYVPYCTGDVHSGSEPAGEVDGVTHTAFVGGDNFQRFLARIVPTFPDVDRVLITGQSAGGFGTAFNYWNTIQAFGEDVRVVAVDDAGPPMRDPYFATCLQNLLRTTWNMDAHLPADCDECLADEGAGFLKIFNYISEHYQDASFGLISSLGDGVIRTFWEFGLNDCGGLSPSYPADQYTEGLTDLKNYFDETDSGGTFYFDGSDHTVITSSNFYTTSVSGTSLRDWFADILEGTMSHVAP